MKKLKPIHWILIAVLIAEIIAIGVILIVQNVNKPTDVEIPLDYAKNEDGSYSLLSLTETAEEPVIVFKSGDKEYTYDKSLVEILDAYQRIDSFKSTFADATEDMWDAFKEQVDIATSKATRKQHPLLFQLSEMAQSSYSVERSQVYNNSGMYTISATTTIDSWQSTFGRYRIKKDGKVVPEMALGAVVTIGDLDYPAIVYTIVNDNGNKKDDKTAQEVSLFVLFGIGMMNDIPLSDATVAFLTPDTGEPFAHANLKVTYLATTNERCFRDLKKLGGI